MYQVIYNEAGQLSRFQLPGSGTGARHSEHPPGRPLRAGPTPIGSLLRFDPKETPGIASMSGRGPVPRTRRRPLPPGWHFHPPCRNSDPGSLEPWGPRLGGRVSNPGSFLPTLDNAGVPEAEFRSAPPRRWNSPPPDQVAARHHLGLVVIRAHTARRLQRQGASRRCRSSLDRVFWMPSITVRQANFRI